MATPDRSASSISTTSLRAPSMETAVEPDDAGSPNTRDSPSTTASVKPVPIATTHTTAGKVTSPLDLMPRYMRNALRVPEKPAAEIEDLAVEEASQESAPEDESLDADEDEDDADDAEMAPPKRKRSTIDYSALENPGSHKKARMSAAERRRSLKVVTPRGVPVGVWRDSSEVADADKHAVFGFVDIHDRLRTRLHPLNRRMEELVGNAPFGAGKCWVTLDRVIFDDHLRDLTSAQIKEYVRLRSDAKPGDTDEEQIQLDRDLAREAMKHGEPPGPNNPVVSAKHPRARPASRISKAEKARLAEQVREEHLSHRRSTPGTPQDSSAGTPSGFQPVNAPQILRSQGSDRDNCVVIGYWPKSDSPDPLDKHAAGGVIGNNDSFRIKILRSTRDGRPLEGNYPKETGGLWLVIDDVVREPHLNGLTRYEIKEYCRARLRQTALGETEEQRQANEATAVLEARKAGEEAQTLRDLTQPRSTWTNRLSSMPPGTPVNPSPNATLAPKRTPYHEKLPDAYERVARVRSDKREDGTGLAIDTPSAPASGSPHASHEAAPSEYKDGPQHNGTSAHPPLTIHSAPPSAIHPTPPPPFPHLMHHYAPHHPPMPMGAIPNGRLHPMNDAGVPIEYVQPLHAMSNAVRFWNGIKYERTAHGPFAGRLVSAPQLINIDGEDLVEYRVLTKPSLF